MRVVSRRVLKTSNDYKGNEKVDKLAKETLRDDTIKEHITNSPCSTNPPLSPDSPDSLIPSLTGSKLNQQRYPRPTKKMAFWATRQTPQTRLNVV